MCSRMQCSKVKKKISKMSLFVFRLIGTAVDGLDSWLDDILLTLFSPWLGSIVARLTC